MQILSVDNMTSCIIHLMNSFDSFFKNCFYISLACFEGVIYNSIDMIFKIIFCYVSPMCYTFINSYMNLSKLGSFIVSWIEEISCEIKIFEDQFPNFSWFLKYNQLKLLVWGKKPSLSIHILFSNLCECSTWGSIREKNIQNRWKKNE